jgi:hypothetical protein
LEKRVKNEYDNDLRVVRIDAHTYWLPNGGTRWTVRYENGLWRAYARSLSPSPDYPPQPTAYDAIYAIIGEPQ